MTTADATQPRTALLLLLWAAGGLLTWFVALYTFSYAMVPLATPVRKFLHSNVPSQFLSVLTTFIIAHAAEYIWAVLLAALLCYLTGFRWLWLISFVVAANGWDLYVHLVKFGWYLNYYPTLPSWVLVSFIQGLISIFILFPLASWVGCIWGRKLREKRGAF